MSTREQAEGGWFTRRSRACTSTRPSWQRGSSMHGATGRVRALSSQVRYHHRASPCSANDATSTGGRSTPSVGTHLLRNAADVNAGATHRTRFHHCHLWEQGKTREAILVQKRAATRTSIHFLSHVHEVRLQDELARRALYLDQRDNFAEEAYDIRARDQPHTFAS